MLQTCTWEVPGTSRCKPTPLYTPLLAQRGAEDKVRQAIRTSADYACAFTERLDIRYVLLRMQLPANCLQCSVPWSIELFWY